MFFRFSVLFFGAKSTQRNVFRKKNFKIAAQPSKKRRVFSRICEHKTKQGYHKVRHERCGPCIILC